jgi:hypothetical protein
LKNSNFNHHVTYRNNKKFINFHVILFDGKISFYILYHSGIPPPRVTWWREHALVEDSFHELPDGSVKSVLKLNRLSREDLEAVSLFEHFH